MSEKNEFTSSRTETDAFKATKEFKEKFHNKDSFFYEPWQFADYEVSADTLKTTYDEINIWSKEEAIIRPGWKVDGNKVHVPNIFSKISGVYSDIVKYRDEINSLIGQKNVLFFKHFPMFHITSERNISKIYSSLLNNKGKIDKEKLLGSEYWKYSSLKTGIQENIAERIIEFCELPDFWKLKCFSIDIHFSLLDKFANLLTYKNDTTAKEKLLMKMSILNIMLKLDKNLLNLLQNFDYPLGVPKIVIYNNSKSGNFSFSDAVQIMFMNSMGVDIIIFNPAGTNDIENFINESYFDLHRLQFINENLKYRKNNFFIRIVRKIKEHFNKS
ncbi:hypothetical protein BJV85_000903 [Clostridium acetobutylicum]|uniref:Uncharacterized protein, YceG B.subtilis homolog n=1 Tax=Clostridium acetobutylicum (strain ATCC 824 / DSM 792 / JCM 1419 / IAM 19013 / LMG 5710 / NBRC 13948 / NRRL B-527 / VKM B-1787 / 2291 / W) TaxID=272562 RepID=Q97EW3_CLOAB|nr:MULTISPECIES: YceG family protein [Clostridium]AAK80934.1 Uncharacterized protein, YceG B.subtilis homolog [Clostridium acetobutylicum ATCC 824]ADZ22036.1 Conserved hypothetical protein [Clostridium acetobutylicum EA 2018]AEI32635.1 hypothetical protein SMB_G3029 [Clostridium acetobutylicum DSM 1731]AWV78655.1 hypothetical protein DK921_00720 [Clostridium acetobutylicum]KHD37293.1 hypothetical protein NL50_08195 [Clostridium acetobutylicum]